MSSSSTTQTKRRRQQQQQRPVQHINNKSINNWYLVLALLVCLVCCTTTTTLAQELQLPPLNLDDRQFNDEEEEVIVVDGFVDTTTCYQHLVEADQNADGKLQANEFVEFTQRQDSSGALDSIDTYQELPLVMQATFVTLTCLCRDERFGGDPRDVDCCLGLDANIAIVGNDQASTSQERTRLFATCFLTDKAIVQVLGSEAPSTSPTKAPTPFPTPFPTTALPSSSPTESPTEGPTLSPSQGPTSAPTTQEPSASPSEGPTSAPVVGPTEMPFPAPTFAPLTPAPTAVTTTTTTPTTPSPTTSVTSAPSSEEIPTTTMTTTSASVFYSIAVLDGERNAIPRRVYEDDLTSSMDQLATVVIAQQFGAARRLRLRRHLRVNLQVPTAIDMYDVTECPVGLATEDDRCEDIEASIILTDEEEIDPTAVADFEAAMLSAIEQGDLQLLIPQNSPVKILTGLTPGEGGPPLEPDGATRTAVDDDGLSNGAISGIVVGALLVAILPIAFYVGMRRNNEEKDAYGSYEPHDGDSADGLGGPEGDAGDRDVEATTTQTRSPILGAKPANYGKAREAEAIEHMHKVAPVSPDSRGDDDDQHSHGSSSNAGSSGWSSSAGLSSLNTGSAEDSMDMLPSPQQGATLAAIAAASASSRRTERSANLSSPPRGAATQEIDIPPGSVTRSDLDNAIEAGDWAAVGATAALLAAASDSQSQSSRSRNSRSQNTSGSSIDAARAAELDHLVDAGDWEGVVLAAAKFEAQEGGDTSIRSGTASSVRSSSAGSETRSGTGSGTTFTPSVSTSVSESASKAQKRQELRLEVEALVRRVVPDEIDNIDEMMNQFKGREEELVETLRTMQERAVAQKARTAGHKAAKQEARRTVQRGQVPGVQEPPTPTSKDGQSSAGASSEGTDESAQRKRTALELAIEAGDWEAVGEAAALMSDTSMSVNSTSTGELDRLAAGRGISPGSIGSSPSARTGGVNADRVRALDELIDRGDWSAVVEAAGRFSQADKEGSVASADKKKSPAKRSMVRGSPGTDSADSLSKRAKQLKEEEDALAQAEIWMQIAAQSKTEGGTDAGASDAADWAISRSLKSLAKAEAGDDGDSNGGGSKGSRHEDGGDDESV